MVYYRQFIAELVATLLVATLTLTSLALSIQAYVIN
jgi:hypothetical protein